MAGMQAHTATGGIHYKIVTRLVFLYVQVLAGVSWRPSDVAPVIKVPNQLLGAPLNTDVQLECYVEAFPNTINYWVKNRGEMLLNGSKYTIREERSGYKVFMWLVIRSFSTSDIGTYNCVSTNSLGRAEGTLRLYEIKVGPGGPHDNHVSIVGGLAEPARGPRSHSNDAFSSAFLARPFLLALITATLLSCGVLR